MVRLYPVGHVPKSYWRVEKTDFKLPQFVIHPSTSELAEQLVVDPEALANENYSGIYDESGDYVPQYCDNPDDIPQGANIEANPTSPTGAPPAESSENDGGDKSPSEAPALSGDGSN